MPNSELILPEDLRQRVEALLEQPLIDPELLRKEVRRHMRAVEIVARTRPIQVELARSIEAGLHKLLDSLTESTPTQRRQWIQAACRYFSESGDDEHDMESPSGMDDDAQVFFAVARACARPDLIFDLGGAR